MSMTPEMVRVLATPQGQLPPDEHLFSATAGTFPKGDAQLDPRRMSVASGFPLDSSIYLGITEKRLLVWKIGFNSKVGKLLGSVELGRVKDVEIVWNKKLAILAIGLNDAPPVIMRALDSGSAEHFRMAYLRLTGRA